MLRVSVLAKSRTCGEGLRWRLRSEEDRRKAFQFFNQESDDVQTPLQQVTRSSEKVSLSYSTTLGDVRVRIDANSKRSQVTRPKNDFKQHLRGVSQVMGAEQLKKSTMQMLKAWSLWKSF